MRVFRAEGGSPYLSEPVHFRNRGSNRCLAAVVVRVHDAEHVALYIFPDVHHGEHGGAPTSPSIAFVAPSSESVDKDSWHYPCEL